MTELALEQEVRLDVLMFPAILIYTMKSHFVLDFFWENNLGPCKHSRCLFSVFFIQYMFAF